MKAMLVHGPRDVRLHDLPTPKPGPGEVLVQVKSVGICGSDVHNYVYGEIGGAVIAEPLSIGHELSGVIAALGPGVQGPAVGTPVAVDPSISCGHCELCLEGEPHICAANRFFGVFPTHGGFREYLAHPADLVVPLPDKMTFDEGALLEPMGIAMYVTELANVRLGDRVAVLGAGPIGLLTIEMVLLAGAAQVAATDIVPERVAAAKRSGASEAWNASETDVVKRIWDWTGGRGVDIAIECTGAPETVEQAMEVTRPGGTVVLVGIPAEDRMSFRASVPRRKGLTVKFDRRMNHTYPRCIELWRAGRINLAPLATHHFPLERLAEAFELVIARADGVLKCMITV
ncbi:MAG: zinc-dependent alcohol dehydrogenase [Anaerolineae bacterium]